MSRTRLIQVNEIDSTATVPDPIFYALPPRSINQIRVPILASSPRNGLIYRQNFGDENIFLPEQATTAIGFVALAKIVNLTSREAGIWVQPIELQPSYHLVNE